VVLVFHISGLFAGAGAVGVGVLLSGGDRLPATALALSAVFLSGAVLDVFTRLATVVVTVQM
jgi:hypothetical protein